MTGFLGAAAFIAVFTLNADWRAYTVQGGSMEPHYQQGDVIVTSAARADAVQPGQIIVFTADWASEKYEQRVVHRVAAVGTINDIPIAYTRGDANAIADPRPVDLRNDVRVVRFSLPADGIWLALIAGPLTVAIAATFAAGLTGAAISTSVPPIVSAIRGSKGTQIGQPEELLPLADLRTKQQAIAQSLRPPVLAPTLPVRRIR